MRPDPDLERYDRDFAANYHALNYGRSLVGATLRRSHVLAERPFGPSVHFPRVLEVGAATGEHLGFVRHRFDRYTMTDLGAEMLARMKVDLPPAVRARVTVERQDANALTYPAEHFDRLIATHVLEHLPEPHRVLREWHRVVRPGGVITLVLPCDPGLLWRLGRHLGPRRRARRAGLPYDYVMAREHINSITNLRALVRYYFDDVSERFYPFDVPLTDVNLFYICQIVRA